MYVYKRTEPDLYTVGFYGPSGEWHSESDHSSKEAAAWRVHYLNGGSAPDLSDAGPYATKEDVQTARELGITVHTLRAHRAADDQI